VTTSDNSWANFEIRVNRYQGLFFFDASFRPVPLEQHFIGVAGKPRSQASIRNMDQVVFDKVRSHSTDHSVSMLKITSRCLSWSVMVTRSWYLFTLEKKPSKPLKS
jgi:hypothetical protein